MSIKSTMLSLLVVVTILSSINLWFFVNFLVFPWLGLNWMPLHSMVIIVVACHVINQSFGWSLSRRMITNHILVLSVLLLLWMMLADVHKTNEVSSCSPGRNNDCGSMILNSRI